MTFVETRQNKNEFYSALATPKVHIGKSLKKGSDRSLITILLAYESYLSSPFIVFFLFVSSRKQLF